MEPHSEVKAVWFLETLPNAESATLDSYAQSLILRRVLCKSPTKTANMFMQLVKGIKNNGYKDILGT